jgi:hypothetical protein
MDSKSAALAVGATVGLGALVLKLPLWAGLLGFAAGAFATKSLIDRAGA